MRYIALILLIPLALSAQATKTGRGGGPGNPGAANAAPPPPPTPTADLATVEGQVFNAVGGTPLRKATVTLNRGNSGPMAPGTRTSYSATTDAAGRYSITGIEPGTYRFNADHTGFLSMQYNARRPQGPGTPLDVGRAERKSGVDFRLTPHGVISGKITDEDGDPLEGVQMQIMRVVYNQGKKQLQVNGGESTNDLGEFRLSGISPGKYYLCAMYRNRNQMVMMNGMGGVAGGGPGGSAGEEDYVATYYPGVHDIAAASAIEMGPGDQAQGVNMRLTKAHTVSLSGRVIDSSSPPPPEPAGGRGGAGNTVTTPDGQVINVFTPVGNSRVQVRLQPRNSLLQNGMTQNNTTAKVDGTFVFPSVPPGPYYLVAVNNQGRGNNGPHATKQAVDVGNSNMEGITVTMTPGATITGHVHYDGDPPSPLPSLTVSLMPREQNMGLGQPQPAKVDADGNFHFDDVNLDQYNVNINTPQGLYLKSLRSGNTDVLISGLDLSSGAASLDILMGTNPPVVGGSVLNPGTQQPAAAVTVVLIPRDKDRQGSNRFYSSSSTDQYGNFSFSRVMPGSYDVYAWEDVLNGQWYDPDWMKTYEGKGESITAQEGSPVTVKLTMIPAK